jgi:hypothetical protein
MSRAYRVRVRESVRHTVRAEDHVSTTLELLEILPREEIADLLRQELSGRGFRAEDKDKGPGKALVRRGNGLTIAVDPATGSVTARAELVEEVEHHGQREGFADTDWGTAGREKTEAALREGLREELKARAGRGAERVQQKATALLEAALADLRGELDQVVNRVTAEALKRKAARLGQIKEMTEDLEAGSLTIVLEV